MHRHLVLQPQHGVLADAARGRAGVKAVMCTGNAATAWPATTGLMAPNAAAAVRHQLRPEEAPVG